MRLSLVLALICFPALAAAQQRICGASETVAELLARGWGETRQSVALDGAGSLVETYAAPETGTWTIAVTKPGGPTCIVASGHSWEAVREPEGKGA